MQTKAFKKGEYLLKEGQIFGHIPSKKLFLGMESFATKPYGLHK